MRGLIFTVVIVALFVWMMIDALESDREAAIAKDAWNAECVDRGGYVLERYRAPPLCVPVGTVIDF